MTGERVEVRLLGGFEVTVDGTAVAAERWRRRRAAALVKLLALAPGHGMARDRVLEALWPDLDPAATGANLRKVAHHARRALAIDDAVALDGSTVRLLPAGTVETDVARFEHAARQALERGDAAACRRAAACYTGDLLPDDRYEPWCEQPRAQLRMLHRDLLASGQLWGRLLELDPTSELAHRGIIATRLEAGDRAGAIRQFDLMRTVLRDELGVSPDPASVALYERVLAHEGRDVPTPAERARALLAWGVLHWERSELAEAEATAIEVRALAVDAGLGRELAEASELLGLVAYAQGRWGEVFAREFVDTATRTPQLAPFVLDANLCMSEFALHEADGLAAVHAFADRLLTVAARTGSDQVRAVGLLLRGDVRLFSGEDLEAAVTDLTEAAALHRATGSATGAALATERLAQAEAARGRAVPAGRLRDDARRLASGSAVARHLLPLVYGGLLHDTEPTAGTRPVDLAEAALAGQRACDPCSMSLHVGATMVCARAGQRDRARAHLAEAERIAAMWKGGAWHAAIAEARAVLRHADGADDAEVRDLLETAAEQYTAAGRHRDAARCATALTTG